MAKHERVGLGPIEPTVTPVVKTFVGLVVAAIVIGATLYFAGIL